MNVFFASLFSAFNFDILSIWNWSWAEHFSCLLTINIFVFSYLFQKNMKSSLIWMETGFWGLLYFYDFHVAPFYAELIQYSWNERYAMHRNKIQRKKKKNYALTFNSPEVLPQRHKSIIIFFNIFFVFLSSLCWSRTESP